MVKLIIDTSVFINTMRGYDDGIEKLSRLAEKGKVKLYLPVIVLGELLAGRSMKYKEAREGLLSIIKGMTIIDIDISIATEYGKLRREGEIVGNDAWIGACCKVLKADLATLNIKDFKKIKGLKLYNE